MILRQKLLDNIIEKLSFIKSKVSISNPLNLTDTNIYSENFFRDFLNLLYGYNLKNTNISEQNSAAIDLGDENQKICFQVTSTSAITKTRKTVQAFIKNKLTDKYERLIILNIVEKSNHKEKKIGDTNGYQLDTQKDMWDISTLIAEIGNLADNNKIQKISDFLDANIKFSSKHTIPNEVQTFISLIEFLSNEEQQSAGNGYIENPDPNGKINKKFANHSEFLKQEYQNLFLEYGQVLTEVLESADLGQARIRRLQLHLRIESDQVLTECNDDPVAALNILVNRYAQTIQENGSQFDISAIRFFLIDQLIKCNVFPLKAEVK